MIQKGLSSKAYTKMCVANTLVCSYLFALQPLLYFRTGCHLQLNALSLLCFSLGMLIIGPFNAYMVERFHRKSIYLYGLLLLMMLHFSFVYAENDAWLIGTFFLQGITFGAIQNTLGNTMVNDFLTSAKRTSGDNLYAWYGRLGMPIGWLIGLATPLLLPLHYHWAVLSLCLLAFLQIATLTVPIKAPVHTDFISFDRFWRTKATPLSLLTLLAATMEGIFVAASFAQSNGGTQAQTLHLLLGFMGALIAQHVVFKAAVKKAEMVTGVVLLSAGFFMQLHPLLSVNTASFIFLGAGIGMLSARLLLYFLRLSGHCLRGTSQNTYMLCWRGGFALGFLIISLLVEALPSTRFLLFTSVLSLSLALLFLFAYLLWVHPWFDKHRDREL